MIMVDIFLLVLWIPMVHMPIPQWVETFTTL